MTGFASLKLHGPLGKRFLEVRHNHTRYRTAPSPVIHTILRTIPKDKMKGTAEHPPSRLMI